MGSNSSIPSNCCDCDIASAVRTRKLAGRTEFVAALCRKGYSPYAIRCVSSQPHNDEFSAGGPAAKPRSLLGQGSLVLMSSDYSRTRTLYLGKRSRWLAGAVASLLLQAWHGSALAQTAPGANGGGACTITVADAVALGPCLATLVNDKVFNFNGLELAAAQADDAAYANLLKVCGPSGSGCAGSQLNLFIQLRELEDNAAQLLGIGQSVFSLNLSAQALGFALRW